MPSEIQKLAARVRTIADECHGWSTAAGQQADRCRATANRARALRQRGQGNPRVLDALVSQLDAAARECETTAARLAQLSRMLFEFADWLAMPTGPAKIASKPANVVAGSGIPDATPPTPNVAPANDEKVPDFVTAAAHRLRDRVPHSKTVGLLLDGEGNPLSNEIWSGEDGPGRGAPRLRRDGPKPWAGMTPAKEHVEGHAAAILRQDDAPSGAVLVLTKKPCPGRYGCRQLLPDLLPRGTTLRVYVVAEDGTVELFGKRPYRGNGLGVKR